MSFHTAWIKSGQTIAAQNPPLSASVNPTTDKREYGWIVRYVP
jgi:hypothetical protein